MPHKPGAVHIGEEGSNTYAEFPTFPTIRGKGPEFKGRIKLPSSDGFEDLVTQFESEENKAWFGKRKTVSQDVEDYQGHGPGRVIYQDKTNAGDAGLYFIPSNTEYNKGLAKDINDLNNVYNAAQTILTLGVATKGAVRQRNQQRIQHENLAFEGATNITPKGPLSLKSQQDISGTTTKGQLQTSEAAVATRLEKFKVGASPSVKGITQPGALNLEMNIAKSILNGEPIPRPNLVDRLFPGTTKAKKLLRERINSPAGDEYRALIAKHDKILENVKPSIIDGETVKVSPLSEAELIKDAQKLIIAKENLKIPNPKVTQHEIGAVIKDGHVARITGGQKSKRLKGEMGEYESRKPFFERQLREETYSIKDDPHEGLFGDKNNPRRVEARTLSKKLLKEQKTIEADHLNILETTMPWSVIKDNTGKFTWRSREQLDQLTKIMKDRYNVDLGNVNENWMMASMDAHRKKSLAKHRTLGSVTDFQKPLIYDDADEIQVVLKNGQQKWLRVEQTGKDKPNKLWDGDVQIKSSQIEKKGNLKLQGREYSPIQKHGASLKLQDTLAAIEDTEELAEAMKLFMIDSGANEVMAGATALASYAYDKAEHLDPLTLKLRKENIPAMINYIDTLLDRPQYANNKLLKDLKRRFTNRMGEFLSDLDRDATRPSSFIETKNQRIR